MRVTKVILVVVALSVVGCTNDYGSLRFVEDFERVGGAAGASGSAGAAAGQSDGGQPATGSGGAPSSGGAAGAGGA
jgi:hypothetical protein